MSARDIPPDLLRAEFSAAWRNLLPSQRASIRESVKRGLEALKTPEPLTLAQWAERDFYLSAESSQREMRWVAYPPQRGILCAMGDDHIQEVDLMKSARVGYTKMLLACIAYMAQHKRRNQCIWQPTDADSDEFCKSEIEPMLRDVKSMAKVFPGFMRKSKSNTLNMKKFLGSLLYMKGGTSAGNYRRMTLQTFYGDEFSAFDDKIEGSADPWTLMWKRLEGATYPKAIIGSTPRVKDADHTERRFKAADVRMRYMVTCPHCDAEHPLMWGGDKVRHGFKWDAHDPEGTARHVCPHCHESITQDVYLTIWQHGVWVSECGNFRLYALEDGSYYWTDGAHCRLDVPPRHVAFHIWTAYSPQTTWGAIVREFLHAVEESKKGDKAPLIGFVNETLGETWEDDGEKTDASEIRRRAENYPLRRVPVGGIELTAGVDTQDSWWAVTVLAVGRDDERWVVDYVELSGDPGNKHDWDNILLPYLQSTFHHWNGAPMKIARTGVDTQGNHTEQAYDFCHRHAALKIHGIKGDNQQGKTIKGRMSHLTVNQAGRKVRTGKKLWFVGVNAAKNEIFSRLQVKTPGPGYIHFSSHLPAAYFDGLTAEVRVPQRTSKGLVSVWKQVKPRNEPLDTLGYAIWASHMQDHPTMSERMWMLREQALEPDLFMPAEAVAPVHGPASTAAPIEVSAVEVGADHDEEEGADDGAQGVLPLPLPERPAPPRSTERTAAAEQKTNLFDVFYG